MSTATAQAAALQLIKTIAEGSTTANSLPHIARIAGAALGPAVFPDAPCNDGRCPGPGTNLNCCAGRRTLATFGPIEDGFHD